MGGSKAHDPALRQQAIAMAFDEGVKTTFIAERLALPVGTVSGWVSIEKQRRLKIGSSAVKQDSQEIGLLRGRIVQLENAADQIESKILEIEEILDSLK